jgi:hypothetical protein
MNVRDVVLEAVKRPALRALHATPRGEAAILRVYLEGEEHAERAVLMDPVTQTAPPWLARWLVKHRADEARHADLLRARIRTLTGDEAATAVTGKMDPVSRWKMRRLARLAQRSAPRFSAGLLVPILAIAWRMERMGVKVFRRHVDVLRAGGTDTPTLPLLEKILRDERGHVAACERALSRLVTAPEQNDLAMLVFRIDRIERAFGVLGAAILFTFGVTLWLVQPFSRTRTAPASSTSPSPTRAVT